MTPRASVPPPTGDLPGQQELIASTGSLPLGRPESKKTYQIARKKLFSENELADWQSPPA